MELCDKRSCCSVAVESNSLWPYELKHTRFPCPSLSPGVCSNSIESVMLFKHLILCCPFSSCSQPFPASGSLQGVSCLHQVAKLLELQHQFSSAEQSCPTLCNPMEHSTPGLLVHHQHPKFTQTHVYWVSDAIQPSHPLLSPSPPAFNLSQHQGLFKWVSSSHQVAKVLELQHQTFQ